MRKTLTTLAFAVIAGVSVAQQDAQFSQNMFNKLDINPGYAGTSKSICATALYRQQWVSFPGAPKTGLISIDAYLPPIHGGLGLTVCSDQLGFDKTFIAELAYSYHLVLGPGVLGIGVNAGMIQKSLNGAWVSTDPYTQDAAIPDSKAATTTYDIGFGLYYTTDNGMFFGISSTHLPQNKLSAVTNNPADNYQYDLARHYYVMAGYPFQINQSLKLIPSILAKTDASSTQLDINARAVYTLNPTVDIWLGASYRLTDAIVALVGFEYNRFKFGYAFDLTTSDIKNYSNNTHEIMLNYCFKPFKNPVPAEHRNVRFL